jgi:hypothetical protein
MTEEERKERKEYKKKYYEANKEKLKEYNKKYCEANKEKKAVRAKKYYEENKKEIKAKEKKYREQNKEKIRVADKKYREENTELERERKKKYYTRIKSDSKLRELRKELTKKYYEKHKKAYYANNAKRRAQHRKATPAWYEQERDKVELIYEKAQEFGFHVDHIVPLQSKKVCGLNTWANLQLLAPEINLSKGNYNWPDMP